MMSANYCEFSNFRFKLEVSFIIVLVFTKNQE